MFLGRQQPVRFRDSGQESDNSNDLHFHGSIQVKDLQAHTFQHTSLVLRTKRCEEREPFSAGGGRSKHPIASSLPINFLKRYGWRCQPNRGEEESREGCEETATPFHTARIQVKGLLNEVGQVIRTVWT